MNWRPHRHRILVRVDVVENRTKGNIILAEQTRVREQAQQVRATILAIGESAVVDDALRVGDRVLIAKWGGLEVPESDNLRLVADEDICAVEVSDE
jgi:co-chaperonin GroES (HSP10)